MTVRLDRDKEWTYDDDLATPEDGSTLEVLAHQGQTYTVEQSLGEEDSWKFLGQTLSLAQLFAPLA